MPEKSIVRSDNLRHQAFLNLSLLTESIKTLEESRAVEEADMQSPPRAQVAAEGVTPQTRRTRRGRGSPNDTPRPDDISDDAYRVAMENAREKRRKVQKSNEK